MCYFIIVKREFIVLKDPNQGGACDVFLRASPLFVAVVEG